MMKGKSDFAILRGDILRFLCSKPAVNFFALKAVKTDDLIFWWSPEPAAFAFRGDRGKPLTITGTASNDFIASLASYLAEGLFSGREENVRADSVMAEILARRCEEHCPGIMTSISRKLKLMVAESAVVFEAPNGFIVRRARLDDLDGYVRLYETFLKDVDLMNASYDETLSQAKRHLSIHSTFVLVDNESGIIGIARAEDGEEGMAKISSVCITPEFRGRGLGKYVTSAVTYDAVHRGLKPMLYANAANPAAVRLYESCGYKTIDESVSMKLAWKAGEWRMKIDDDFYFSEISERDNSSFILHLNDLDVTRNMLVIPYPYTESDADSFISFVKEDTAKHGRPLIWAIRKKSGDLIGCVALSVEIGKSHKGSFGYWLGKPYWGKGVMTKAIRVAVDFAFREFQIVRLEAHVRDMNIGSAAVLLKNGFVEEGLSRKFEKKNDEYFDCKIFAKVV